MSELFWLILGIYIGGMIPLLTGDAVEAETGLPATVSERLIIALTWPVTVLRV